MVKKFKVPSQAIPLNDSGDYKITKLYEQYWGQRLLKSVETFEAAYKLLTELKHFSRRNSFGEMCHDRYLWIEKHPKVKVLVYEAQSYRTIYILEG